MKNTLIYVPTTIPRIWLNISSNPKNCCLPPNAFSRICLLSTLTDASILREGTLKVEVQLTLNGSRNKPRCTHYFNLSSSIPPKTEV